MAPSDELGHSDAAGWRLWWRRWGTRRRWLITPPTAPRSVRFTDASLTIEAASTALASLIIALVGVLAALLGSPVAGAATVGVAIAVLVVAASLRWLQVHALFGSAPMRLLTVLVQVPLAAGGIALFAVSSYLNDHAGTAQSPGTDGPFADGITGFIGLLGLAYVLSSLAVVWGLAVYPRSREYFRNQG
jgi:hypothetical protein